MKPYKTKDFYFAAYLMASGMELQEHNRHDGLTTFVFDNSQELQMFVRKFYDSVALVNPITYIPIPLIIKVVENLPGNPYPLVESF